MLHQMVMLLHTVALMDSFLFMEVKPEMRDHTSPTTQNCSFHKTDF